MFHWCWKCFAATACVFFFVVVLFSFNFPSLDFILCMVIWCVCVFFSAHLFFFFFFFSPFLRLCLAIIQFSMFIISLLFILLSLSLIYSGLSFICVDWWRHYRLYGVSFSIWYCSVAAINHTYTQFSQWKRKFHSIFNGPKWALRILSCYCCCYIFLDFPSHFVAFPSTRRHTNWYEKIFVYSVIEYRAYFLLHLKTEVIEEEEKTREDRNIKIRQQFKWFLHVECVFIECAICTNPLWMAIKIFNINSYAASKMVLNQILKSAIRIMNRCPVFLSVSSSLCSCWRLIVVGSTQSVRAHRIFAKKVLPKKCTDEHRHMDARAHTHLAICRSFTEYAVTNILCVHLRLHLLTGDRVCNKRTKQKKKTATTEIEKLMRKRGNLLKKTETQKVEPK